MNQDYSDKLARRFTEAGRIDVGGDGDGSGDAGRDSRPLAQKIVEERIVQALKRIYDPELPVNIYDLGLIYQVRVDAAGRADVHMTLTTPGCPVAQTFPGMVECAVAEVEGVREAHVELVWQPPWTRERMSEAAQFELGLL